MANQTLRVGTLSASAGEKRFGVNEFTVDGAPYRLPMWLNLNRVFPGTAGGTASEQIAAWVFDNVIRQADFFVDLHGGDLIEALVPFTIFYKAGDPAVRDTSLEMAKAFGIPLPRQFN